MNTGNIYKIKDRFRSFYDYNHYEHPFIFWKDNEDSYIGIMLTTKNSPRYKNIELDKSHIKQGTNFSYGNSIPGNKSYIVPAALIKDIALDHFELIGFLTDDGVEFIRKLIPQLPHIKWYNYIKKKTTQEE